MFSQIKKIPLSIWVIGISSLLLTCSAAMLFSVFALFLTSINVATKDISLIDGIVEGLGYLFKVMSGVFSDYLRKRKMFFGLGALFTTLSRAAVVISTTFHGAVIARIFDRLGNGLSATPRDALVGDYAPKDVRGTSFGIRQALGTFGSVIGSLLVILILHHYQDNFRLVFSFASIPAFLALLLIIFKVKDSKKAQENLEKLEKKNGKFSIKNLSKLNHHFWFLMLIVTVFMLSRFSESIVILYGKKVFSIANDHAVWTIVVYNIAWAASSYISGPFVDKINNALLMILGILITMLSGVIVILSTNYSIFLVGVIFWGVQIGFMHNLFCAGITKFAPPELRGTAFGIFYFINAVCVFIANIIGGRLMDKNPNTAFLYSAIMCIFAIITVIYTQRKNLKKIKIIS